jgi:tRNA threonylcarbamoyladenosine biosynthesis protein TsaE
MTTKLLHLSYTLETIREAVTRFWSTLYNYRIFAFSGEMGAGKTTFIHHLCDYLQVQDAVSSPTFALINEYHFTDTQGKDNVIFHLDWYRLKDTAEAISAGMEDCLLEAAQGNAFCFIEWPERAGALLPAQYLRISIETINPLERTMEVSLIA